MALPVIQPSFATGELSPGLYGRVDLSRFHAGAALLRNYFVDYRGGVSNRAGTQFVGPCLAGINRLIPFQFSTLQTYALVFSDHKMHVVMEGALVLEDTPVLVNALAQNPMRLNIVFSIPAAPVWNAGDWIFLEHYGAEITNGISRRYDATVLQIDAVIAGPAYHMADFTGALIDGSNYQGDAAFIHRVYTLATPYAAADLALLKFTQSADVMTITHPNYPAQELTRTAHNAWTMTPISFAPSSASPGAMVATPTAPGGSTYYSYVVTAVDANGVTESLPGPVATAANSQAMSATAGAAISLVWAYAGSPSLFNVYRQAEVRNGAPAPGQLFGFVGTVRADPATPGVSAFIDCNIVPDFTRTPPIDPGILAAVDSYPACATYFQQRLVFAGTNAQPQTAFASKTGDFHNMQYSSPSRADDAIVATLVGSQVNAIKHLLGMDALLAFTSSSAWKVDAGTNGGPIAPSSIDATIQAYNGCSDAPPIIVGRDILYVQAKGSSVRDLAYNEFVKIYTGQDLSVLASHLFLGHRITEWAYAEEPHKVIWCVRNDGVALIFTYLKEQEVYAWSHAITKGQFKSVAAISEGDENAVYFIVQRKVGGRFVQYVERLASRLLGDNPELGVPADFSRFWFADAALSTTLTYPAATLYPNNGEALDEGGWWTDAHLIAAAVIVGGANYTAAPTAVIEDPTGAGAAITLTVVGGIITAATVTAKGENYSNPVVRVVDTTGAGAVVAAQLGREIELLADAAVLGAVTVGSLFIGNGGYGPVLAVNSARSMTVDMRQALANDFPMAADTWSVTPKVASVAGLDHLEGMEVAILADGNVVENQTVVQGAVTLEQPAAAVVVGLPYVARMESLYCDLPGESPTVQGRRKHIPAVTVRTANSRGLKCGVKGEELKEFKERDDTALMGDPIPAYTGDRKVLTPGTYDVRAQVVVEQALPLPATILALIPEVTVGDSPSP